MRNSVSSLVSVTLFAAASLLFANKDLLVQSLIKHHVIARVWLSALSTTLLISLVPYLLLFAIPLDNTREYESLLKVCLAFASGGLLGDAFLHLIPEAIENSRSVRSSADHHGLSVGLWILTGFTAFFFVEKMVRMVKQEHTKHRISDNHSPLDQSNKTINNNNNNDTNRIKIAGYLNLIADMAHNFTDGLAIGSSFLLGQKAGIITGMAIMLHEIPHEIGDYAVLIKCGCRRKVAMNLQLFTAVGALTGTVVSLAVGGLGTDGATTWILPFTGGGFIYIATVSILPELLGDTDFKQAVKEIAALVCGILLMCLVII